MIKIPTQLQRPEFRFIKLQKNSKVPIEKNWQQEQNYSYEKIKDYEGNIGIVAGFGNLVLIDCDNIDLYYALIEFLPQQTFTIKSALKGLPHLYFISDEPFDNNLLIYDGQRAGELRAKNEFCLTAPSRIDGKKYEVWMGAPIAKINKKEIMEKLKPYIKAKEEIEISNIETSLIEILAKDERIKKLFEGDISGFASRSEAEESLVCHLIGLGLDKEQIFKIMASCRIGKWQEAHIDYRELTFKKALELITQKKRETEEERLKVFSLKELHNLEIKPIQWYVKPLIPLKSIVVLGGKRGSFKSFGAMCMALCIASGKPFLKDFKTTKGKVLYIDEENGIDVLKERFEKLAKGLEIENNEEIEKNLLFTSFENIKLDRTIWREKLKRAVNEFKPDIVIIDSLRRVISFDENIAGEISGLFTNIIRPLSEEFNLTWILIHHMRKGLGRAPIDEMDEIRGSSDIANYADAIIIFERRKGEADKFILKQVKIRRARELPPKLIQLNWNEENLSMECVGDAQDTLFADQMCAEMIMNWLAEQQKSNFKSREVMEAMKPQKQSSRTIYRALDLLQQGDKPKIRKVGRGQYEINVSASLSQFEK